MGRSENPFQLSFWLGEVDPRPLAIFRVAFGLTLLHDLANYSANLRAFLTDGGMLPRGVQDEPLAWSAFDWVGDTASVTALFCAGVAVVVAFTLGYRTRVSAALSWLFLTSIHTRNLYVTDGGDDLVRNLLFLSIFTDLGGSFSLDARRRGTAHRPVPAVGLRFLQLHIALLYFVAARLKFRAGWLTHNVIYQCLQLTGFVRPPGHLLLSVPTLCFALGVVTLGLEGAFAFLAFSPVRISLARALAIGAGFGVQFGILITMRVGVFTETMVVAMLLFVQPEWLDHFASSARARGLLRAPEKMPPPEPAAPLRLDIGTVPPGRLLTFGFLCIHFLVLAWGPFAARRFPLPAWVVAERRLPWLDQPFGLFDVVYDIPTWDVAGVTTTGNSVEVLPVAVPDLVPKVAWSFSRWYKFTFKERERPYRFASLGGYLCRAYGERAGEPLRELTLFETLTPPTLIGVERRPARRRERWHQSCVTLSR